MKTIETLEGITNISVGTRIMVSANDVVSYIWRRKKGISALMTRLRHKYPGQTRKTGRVTFIDLEKFKHYLSDRLISNKAKDNDDEIDRMKNVIHWDLNMCHDELGKVAYHPEADKLSAAVNVTKKEEGKRHDETIKCLLSNLMNSVPKGMSININLTINGEA